MLKRLIFILFNLLMIITPFAFTGVNEELFEFNKMLLVYSFSVLIGFFWILRMIKAKKIIFKRNKLDLPLLIFLISQIIATIFSIHPRTSIFGYYTRFHGGLLSTLAYIWLFYALISNLNKNQIFAIIRTGVVAAGLISLYAIPEHFGHSPSCWLISGKFNTDCWVQDVQSRVFATLGQPNWLAGYLIAWLPVSLWFYFKENNVDAKPNFKLPHWIYLAIAGLIYTALLLTKSRSGLIGLACGLIVFAADLIRRWLNKKPLKLWDKKLWNKKIAFFVVVFLSLGLVFGTAFTPSLKQFYFKFTNSQIAENPSPAQESELAASLQRGTGSGKIRQIVWQGAIDVWKNYPLFGSGVETFAYSYYQHRPLAHNLVSEWDFLYNKAHNEWLNFLATTGIFGLGSYLFLLGSIAWLGFQPKKKPANPLLLSLLAGIVALSASNFLGFSTVMVTLSMFVLAAAIVSLNNQQTRSIQTKSKSAKFRLLDIAIILPLTGIALHLLLSIWSIWSADYIFAQGKSLINQGEYTLGVQQLETAVKLRPKVGLFHDELAETYAKIAAELYQLEQTQAADEFAQLAIDQTNQALRLNPVHLNFYQTRYRAFSHLSLINSQYLQEANDALEAAQALAPTHPKLIYNQASVKIAQEKQSEAIELLKQAISMKPNYLKSRYKLGQIYQKNQEYQLAAEQYQAILNLVPSDQNVQKLLNEVKQLQANEN